MSIFHLTNDHDDPTNRQKIYIQSCDCSEGMKISETLEVRDLFFDAQNGDKIELSSVANKGSMGSVLKSNGNGTVQWGSDLTGGVNYTGSQPTTINQLSLYNSTDGSTIKNSTLTEQDLLDTQAKANTNETDISNLQNDKLNIDGSSIMSGNLQMGFNSLTNVNDLSTTTISAKNGVSISLLDDFNVNNYDLIGVNEIKTNIISTNTTGDVNLLNTLDMNTRDILNVESMTITSTAYISKIADLPTPVGDFYVIPDNTTWIILGQITLQYGIQYGVNCSLRGIDFSAQITFDESVRDCVIKAVDNNFYLSQITIVNGGGRFSLSGRGLLDAINYNLGAPAPFYGRNKRFKVTDCNILRPWKIGTVEGFGTLNVTNNFFNGGGGLPGQASTYYTNEGLAVSDGLSLEFNNNKMVLMAGAQQASTLKLLNMKARVSPLLGFNAVTITGNIFHPRSTETGIDFDADSRTQLGNISGNVFIRTGGTAPLINYTNQTLYNNYNPLSIENYSVNANTGVVDSEPNLKSALGTSVATTAVNPTRSELVPQFNDQVLQINSSSRFAVQVDLGLGTQAVVANERITDNDTLKNYLILDVEPAIGVSPNISQIVYLTDFSATPAQIPNPLGRWTTPSGGDFGEAYFKARYRYSEKDPRKLVVNATFNVSTGNNETYFIAPGDGSVADAQCEVEGTATNLGSGGTVSLNCSRVYNDGDIINFYVSSASGSSTSINKGIINIK
jgi:hypothetical protein